MVLLELIRPYSLLPDRCFLARTPYTIILLSIYSDGTFGSSALWGRMYHYLLLIRSRGCGCLCRRRRRSGRRCCGRLGFRRGCYCRKGGMGVSNSSRNGCGDVLEAYPAGAISLTFACDLGNSKTAAPMPPAMAMLRGRKKPDMVCCAVRSYLGEESVDLMQICLAWKSVSLQFRCAFNVTLK